MTLVEEVEHNVRPAPKATAEGTPEWRGFEGRTWRTSIDVGDFIRANVKPYTGNDQFLSPATARTRRLWLELGKLFELERARGVLATSQVPSSITSHAPGYIDRELERIVGLQTDAPLGRAVFPNAGYRQVARSLEAYGVRVERQLAEIFTRHRKTHNDGVFDAYPADVLKARSSHLLTGLPDSAGRGRIIGDYRRVALYGVNHLLAQKRAEKAALDAEPSSDVVIREREEIAEQIRALRELASMAKAYGCDITRPARDAREAVQWLYFAYLGAVKEQNGAAMSLGRVSTFLDIYFERDQRACLLGEPEIQELIDDLAIKLRIVRFLRAPEYGRLYSGEPVWITEALGGIGDDKRPLVTKTSFRFLQTLYNLGPAAEPNFTVLWSPRLPDDFKRFCAQVSLDTSAIGYCSDELLRKYCGDDAAIAGSVSAMRVGKQMQFSGGAVNLAKCLLYAINGGRDEITGQQVMPAFEPVTGDVLEIEDVLHRMDHVMAWAARTHVDALNCIHYMHDRYAYERLAMALHDHSPLRTMAFGIAGLSVAADSLSAIDHGYVKIVRDARGLIVDYETSGDFPKFGNDDERCDAYAKKLVERFMAKLRQQPLYRDAMPTQSVLTIASNVACGRQTGSTPDGRRTGQPLAPGANPLHGRDTHGLDASAASLAKIPYADCQDGIAFTANLDPNGLGEAREKRLDNLVATLDRLFRRGLFHIDVNVLSRETLLDAMAHPDGYSALTMRVSGHAASFIELTRDQQNEVVAHTFHGRT